MRDTYISLCYLRFQPRPQGAFPAPPPKPGKSALGTRLLRFVRCHVTNPLFGNCNRMKLCSRKFPRAVQLKIILCDDVQGDGEF